LDKTEIETEIEYNYLGQIVAFDDRIEEELKARRNKSRGKFWLLKKVFKNKKSRR